MDFFTSDSQRHKDVALMQYLGVPRNQPETPNSAEDRTVVTSLVRFVQYSLAPAISLYS